MTEAESQAHEGWHPSEAWAQDTRLYRLMEQHDIEDFAALHRRSIEDPEWFYDAVSEDILQLDWFEPYEQAVDDSDGRPFTRFYTGGRHNLVHHCLDRHLEEGRGNQVAFIWENEDGAEEKWTYLDVDRDVARLTNALRSLGIGEGDRVGVFLPMIPETVISILALAKMGAILAPIFSGFGAEAVAARLEDADAGVLITADGFKRRGGIVPMKETADEAASRVDAVDHVVTVPYLGREDAPWNPTNDIDWEVLLDPQRTNARTMPLDSDAPFMLIYTSGTTGRPKGTVHSHNGFPLKAALDLALAFDLRRDDRLFWLTDIGWMMGPWEILGAMLLGSTFVMYDGSPDYPEPGRVWQLVERHQVTTLGISPTLIRALMPAGTEPVAEHELDSLRVLGSTGEPWDPESWRWFFEEIGGEKLPIINYSGGTEVSGGLLGCFQTEPIKPCAFNGAFPGIDAAVFNEDGEPAGAGKIGELVVRSAWAGMTDSFWDGEGGRDDDRYVDAYWSRWEDVWVHGDACVRDEDGAWYIQGRSDDTMNIAGKRVGPAEFEAALVAHPEVAEAAAAGVPDEVKGQAVVCFVTVGHAIGGEEDDGAAGGEAEDDGSAGGDGSAAADVAAEDQVSVDADELVAWVAERLGKPYRPREVHIVSALPKTRSGKIMRRLVQRKYMGDDLGDVSSLENPEALEDVPVET